jgi:phosphate transport system permease protein
MRIGTRKILDRSFTALGGFSIGLMILALILILVPMFIRGGGALGFRGTIEHRRLLLEKFERGNRPAIEAEIRRFEERRAPIYRQIAEFEAELTRGDSARRRQYAPALRDLKKNLGILLGPAPGAPRPMLARDQFGQTRWDRAVIKLDRVLIRESWDYSDPTRGGVRVRVPRAREFEGTPVAGIFPFLENHLAEILQPRPTFYWGFLTDESFDSHFFGGIWAELLGTFYLTAGAMLFALPMGIMAAIYLTEYATDGPVIRLITTSITTLAGVPSIVFGLFGLAFFINTLHLSSAKSVLAGSLTLALMILPTVIRSAEEAIRAVPRTFKEAALSLGAGRWQTVTGVILPAALPGILTGAIISMGRAAGETAPIIFTAAVSIGKPLTLFQTLTQPTPALSWNIYNLATEHEAMDEIRHVQFGMVLALVSLVLILNIAAIIVRARISKKLKG